MRVRGRPILHLLHPVEHSNMAARLGNCRENQRLRQPSLWMPSPALHRNPLVSTYSLPFVSTVLVKCALSMLYTCSWAAECLFRFLNALPP